MIRRAMLPDKSKLYEDIFGVNDDYYTFFKLFSYGKFANIPEKLLSYRIHGNNSSLQNLKGKFFNTLKIRLAAVLKYNYHPTTKAVIKVVLQTIAALVIPAAFFHPLYMFSKRIYTPQKIAAEYILYIRGLLAYPFSRLALTTKINGRKNA
jgi:hypothetical protein